MNHLNLDDFPHSAHAQELRRGLRRLRFVPLLESSYTVSHLDRVQLRARIWFTVAACVTVLFAVGQVHRAGLYNFVSAIYCGGVLPCAFVLAGIVWSPGYTRWYLPTSRVLVLLFNSLAAILIAKALVEGREEELAALTVNLMAVFFFSGLKYRQALLSCITTVFMFWITALVLKLEQALLVKSMFAIGVTAIIAAIVYRDVELAYRRSFLEGALITELATLDGLTQLMNRRAFDAHLERVWHQAQRDNETVAILMIDIDYFKRYNDTYGHQAGDLALKSVAQVIRSFARRPLDLAARFGGEEFALILYNLASAYVEEMADEVRAAVEDIHTLHPEILFEITVSIGVGMANPTKGRSAEGALQLADEALYEAKYAGRNRSVVKGIDAYLLLKTGAFKKAARRRH